MTPLVYRLALFVVVSSSSIVFDGCNKAVNNSDVNSSRQITGQVFVVTKSAQNIKLGSVTVSATQEQDVLQRMMVKDIMVESTKPILEKQVQEAEKAYLAAEKIQRRLKEQW